MPSLVLPQTPTSTSMDKEYNPISLRVSYIAGALKQRAEGDSGLYFELLDHLSKKNSSSLLEWIQAFSQQVSSLNRHHLDLVTAILRLDWPIQQINFVRTYKHFIEILVSANPFYLPHVIKMLVNLLRYGKNQSLRVEFA
jgi:hypothetical protein